MIVSLAIAGVGTTSQPAATVLVPAAATIGRARILEIGVFNSTAVASPIGIGRPAAIGVTPTSPIDFLPEDSADTLPTGQLQMCTAWGTLPTSPTNFLRRTMIPANIGGGIIWTFPKGLIIPNNGNIVIYNIGAASGVPFVYVVADV